MVKVSLKAVRVDLQTNTPVLLLQEASGMERTLPIFIGPPEATAIAMILQSLETPRPMTHDLMVDVITLLGNNLECVVITELKDRIFYAELWIRTAGGDLMKISSRPSDAIAIALRAQCEMFISDDLMDEEGLHLPSDAFDEIPEGSPEDLVGEFRDFLDTIKPEDFS